MNLASLIAKIDPIKVDGATDREIASLCYDSRLAAPGALFFALRGEKADGARFVREAVQSGAVAVVSEEPADGAGAAWILVKNARAAMADAACGFYQNPSRAMKVAGVTGTNGKTTATFLLKHICERALLRCGMIGTVRYEYADQVIPAARTTPESIEIQELLWKMRSAGCKAAVMEVSSHALAQDRVRGVEFDAAIFTNLTQDHLDYHGTMEAYFAAKCRLFEMLASQKKTGKAVVNMDDRYGSQILSKLSSTGHAISYGMGARAEFRASNVRSDFHGSSYQLDANGRSYLVRLPQIGHFNVYNSLAAIAGAHVMGIEVRAAVLALADAPPVPGRLEAVPGQRAFKVFVDYAHTEDALLNAMKTLRELQPARLIVVFGCGGNRDRGKRPRMGAAVDQLADCAIVTSDNPRKEDPLAIIEDIKPGLRRVAYEVIPDRREAIFRAVEIAGPRDIVLIAGKGHETYQEFSETTVPFDDISVARNALEHKQVEI